MKSDFTSSQNNTALSHVEKHLGVPDFAKSAAVEGLDSLPRMAFADPIRRLFPVNTKSAAYHSAVFFLGARDNSTAGVRLHEQIKTACAAHGIAEEFSKLEKLFEEAVSQVKSANEKKAGKFALEVEAAESVQQFYPINNSAEVEESAHQFAKDASAGKFPLSLAREVAVDLIKAATETGVNMRYLPQSVKDLGVERLPDFERASHLLQYRCKTAGVGAEEQGLYMKLLKSAQEDPEQLPEIVGLTYELDRQCGITKYSRVHPDPYQVFYGGDTLASIEKLASSNIVVDGVLIPVDVYGRIADWRLTGNFQEKTAAALVQLKTAAAADITVGVENLLDEDDRKVLLRVLLDTAKE